MPQLPPTLGHPAPGDAAPDPDTPGHPAPERNTPGQATPARARELARTGSAVLLDVREADEFAAGHAPGALHQPLIALVAGAPLPAAVAGRAVLVLCRSGHRSQHATELLAQRGVRALNVTGGMRAWARAGLPVTTPSGGAGRVK
ncbi:rhodanese-like domain-containing protein [Kitasatospora sp. NPDC097691]|uniref:rhodanese-like domain-containing protein n=1 Tax=Kitasatospora sp. NPDC097691 TaxID=3157231 RepID=UPI00331E63A7